MGEKHTDQQKYNSMQRGLEEISANRDAEKRVDGTTEMDVIHERALDLEAELQESKLFSSFTVRIEENKDIKGGKTRQVLEGLNNGAKVTIMLETKLPSVDNPKQQIEYSGRIGDINLSPMEAKRLFAKIKDKIKAVPKKETK